MLHKKFGGKKKKKKTMFGPLIFICLSLLKLKFLSLLYIDLIMEITQIYGGHHFYKKKFITLLSWVSTTQPFYLFFNGLIYLLDSSCKLVKITKF